MIKIKNDRIVLDSAAAISDIVKLKSVVYKCAPSFAPCVGRLAAKRSSQYLSTMKSLLTRLTLPIITWYVFLCSSVFAQTGSITGRIVDRDDQSSLANVNVVLNDKGIGCITKSDGTFSLTNIAAGTHLLQASLVGFNTARKTVVVGDGNANVEISLQPTPIGMGDVIVTGYRESYTSGDNFSATRIDAPMMELPLSTGQITGKLLEDQNILNVTDALKNISGVAVEFGGANQPLNANIRGFNASIFKDGFRMGGCDMVSPGGSLPIDMTSLDRIEVLKGPSAILYGRGEPGGIINFISKKPSMASEYSLEAMTGSFQQYKVGVSATGALIDDVLAYRFDGTYDKSKSYRDVVKTNTFFLKPSFSLNVSDNTHIRLLGEFSKSEYTPDRGVLMLPSITSSGALTASLAPISSRNYFFGEDVDINSQRQVRTTAEVEHVFSPAWTLRGSASYEQTHELSTDVFDWYYTYQGATPPGFPEGLFPADWTVRPIDYLDFKRTDFSTRIENVFHVSHQLLGMNVSHRILAVMDLLQIDTRYILDYSPWGVLNPVTGERSRVELPVSPHEEMLANSKDYGFAVQDLITFEQRWHLLIGGRYERNTIDVTQLASFNTDPTSTYNKSNGIAPRFGLLYEMRDNLSLYASYMGSYQSPGADYGLWDIPDSLRPERAYQTEVGVKLELFGGRALVTTAVYLIKKYDVITWENNPNGSAPYLFYYNIGKEDAQGFDIDVVGEVVSNLKIMAGYNNQTMKFTNPKKLIVDGKERFGTPKYSGNLWMLYEVGDGFFRGMGIGAGVTFKSAVWVNDANEAQLPGYTSYDATAYYEIARMRFQLNLYNLSNVLSYTSGNIGGAGDPTYPIPVMPNAPFRTTFTIRYTL